MNPKLEDCGNYIEIVDFSHSEKAENEGNPYNCHFGIRIKSGEFSGYADVCEYDYKEFCKFIAALEDMIYFRTKKVTFTEICVGNHIDFVCDKTGHIIVSGEIDTYDHFLRFEFRTDQSALQPFIRGLKYL